jgi:hypothetical protein
VFFLRVRKSGLKAVFERLEEVFFTRAGKERQPVLGDYRLGGVSSTRAGKGGCSITPTPLGSHSLYACGGERPNGSLGFQEGNERYIQRVRRIVIVFLSRVRRRAGTLELDKGSLIVFSASVRGRAAGIFALMQR